MATISDGLEARVDPCPTSQLDRQHHCSVDGTPLATTADAAAVAGQETPPDR